MMRKQEKQIHEQQGKKLKKSDEPWKVYSLVLKVGRERKRRRIKREKKA